MIGVRCLLAFGLATGLLCGVAVASEQATMQATRPVVKAAFLLNFVKFTEWPALPDKAPLSVCVAGDDEVAGALAATLDRQVVAGHPLTLRRLSAREGWQSCQLLFVGEGEFRGWSGELEAIEKLPVLTVSDAAGFARGSGIIELFIQDNRMRFAINVGAAERAGLRLSSRLLKLAQVVEDGRAQ